MDGGTSAITCDGADVIKRCLTINRRDDQSRDLSTYYEIEDCASWIREHDFKVVALQFPDELLEDSADVTALLSSLTEAKLFILGDTTYGSCCVDVIASQHVLATAVIHFGRACLSSVSEVPVRYVFGQENLDAKDCCAKFQQLYPETETAVVVFYDVVYSYAIDQIKTVLLSQYTNLIFSNLKLSTEARPEIDESRFTIIVKGGRTFALPSSETESNYQMFFVGGECLALTNLMLTFNKCAFSTYDPAGGAARRETLSVNKRLMRRYYMVERAKDAHVVGVVAGAPGVADVVAAIERVRDVARRAGKKPYTLVVGKLNAAKLANFAEMDVFVLVACAENTLVDAGDLYRPIVTPFEMELACNAAREWTGDYVTDFRELLPGSTMHVPMSEESSDASVDVSLITGKTRSIGITEELTLGQSTTAVIDRNSSLTMVAESSTAAEYLEQRSWRGLEQALGETAVSKAKEGRRGIAAGYENEPAS